MLVVENIAANVVLPTGQKVELMTILSDTSFLQGWVPTYQADNGTNAFIGASQAMRLYYPANHNFEIVVGTTESGNIGACNFGFTGFLVNVH